MNESKAKRSEKKNRINLNVPNIWINAWMRVSSFKYVIHTDAFSAFSHNHTHTYARTHTNIHIHTFNG